jgi:hypothetical protein
LNKLLAFVFDGQLYRRADAAIAGAALRLVIRGMVAENGADGERSGQFGRAERQ